MHDSGSIEFSGPVAIRRSLVEGCTSSCLYQMNPGGIATISGSEFRAGPGQTAIKHQNCGGSSTSLDVTTTVFSGFGTAISLSCNGSAQTRLVNNTFHANETGVAYTATTATRHRLQNNVFTSQTTDSVTCGGLDAGTWLARDHHLLFGNAADTCVAADPDTLTSSPQYLDAAGYDFRLMPGMSPAIDSGVDAGADLNGAAPGRFHGAAPDRGARETW
jgi:hypothetical protein